MSASKRGLLGIGRATLWNDQLSGLHRLAVSPWGALQGTDWVCAPHRLGVRRADLVKAVGIDGRRETESVMSAWLAVGRASTIAAVPSRKENSESPFWREALAPYAQPSIGRSVLDLATSVVP